MASSVSDATVLIVGKGPSARPVVRRSIIERGRSDQTTLVAALNGAIAFVNDVYCDFLFVNDVRAFDEIASIPDLPSIGTLVVPVMLHATTDGANLVRALDVRHRMPLHRTTEYYELPSNPNRNPSRRYFGAIKSVGETAVAWLLAEGFRKFETVGVDPDGGYHSAFDEIGRHTDKAPDWFAENWRCMWKRVDAAGGTIVRHAEEPASAGRD